MPQGGRLTLSALEEEAGGRREALLVIEDEGVGIQPEEIDTIFQPFRGTFGKGSGLGLAIVHRIVSDYGGRVDVRPRPGGGTAFRVSFPAARPAPAPRVAQEAAS
jgi:signal transduction histidine kinase